MFVAPAQAGPSERRATFVAVTPKNAVVTTGKSTVLNLRVSIDAAEPFYEGKILAELTALNGNGYEFLYLTDPDGDGVYTGRVQLTPLFAVPGNWTVKTEAIGDETGSAIQGPTGRFTIRSKTKITAKATPKKPRKGAAVTLSGRLRTLKYGSYDGFGGRTLQIRFRKKGSTKWTTLTTVKTKRNGTYTKTIRPKSPGSLQLHWKGSTTTTPVTTSPIPVK
ncbi:hypothetical protein LO762_26025 [Actinocorallia sp. API 0066]|uniref:hypothetical protein n=1 Tax=Actinocorallia sp. API 0066 TaxID=2896846 RepID=UPI001E4EC76E|nr:hypothetical protein [Actinocorallia sp. API 0066]MCD0452614.1 hypothetical protein [Actinocorallia sp. API 0066]